MRYKRSIGFENFTEEEINYILSFNEFNELIMPEYIPNGLKLTHNLIIKGVVRKGTPLTLTAKGLTIKKHLEDINDW